MNKTKQHFYFYSLKMKSVYEGKAGTLITSGRTRIRIRWWWWWWKGNTFNNIIHTYIFRKITFQSFRLYGYQMWLIDIPNDKFDWNKGVFWCEKRH